MEICVKDDKRIVEIWLTNAEKENIQLRDLLKPLCKKYHDRKYSVAVFISGKGDLFEGTLDLLVHNKQVLAKKMPNLER